jgi:uncharacterized membrane protein
VQNPHPLLVHFPIAFLVGFAAAALLALVVRRPGLEAFARACLFVGTACAALTVVSGFLAEQNVAPVAAAREIVDEHRTYGYVTLILAALLSAAAAIAPRFPQRAGAWRMARAIGAAALLFVLFETGEHGGELVHEHGVGTKLTAPGAPLHEKGGAATKPAPSDGAPAPTGRDFK